MIKLKSSEYLVCIFLCVSGLWWRLWAVSLWFNQTSHSCKPRQIINSPPQRSNGVRVTSRMSMKPLDEMKGSQCNLWLRKQHYSNKRRYYQGFVVQKIISTLQSFDSRQKITESPLVKVRGSARCDAHPRHHGKISRRNKLRGFVLIWKGKKYRTRK